MSSNVKTKNRPENVNAARCERFIDAMEKPDIYFYRERAPGETLKTGSFTDEEKEEFQKRVCYFRDSLGIVDRFWGLFAVPLKGRVGYQCARYYRDVFRDKGTRQIKEVTPDSISGLEVEARKHFMRCLGPGKNSEPLMTLYAKAYSGIPLDERPAVPALETNNTHNNDEYDEYEYAEDNDYEYDPDDDETGAKWAPDPLTGNPITAPMIDLRTGLVMDETSWKSVLSGESSPPLMLSGPFGEPVRLTKHVLHETSNVIRGVPL